MHIKYNIQKLREILNDLYILTGITIDFLDSDSKSLCVNESFNDFCTLIQTDCRNKKRCLDSDAILLEKCKKSDMYEWHICHAGLYDAAMPVKKDSITVGYLIMGRIRTPQSKCPALPSEEAAIYSQLPFFHEKQLESLKTLLQNILFSNAIEIEYNEIIEEIAKYINDNLQSELSIHSICQKFYISKNLLYKGFKEHFDCTVNEYVTNSRINLAKRLLSQTNMPIYAICEQTGIENYTYFSKLFSKKVGISPMNFRKKPVST